MNLLTFAILTYALCALAIAYYEPLATRDCEYMHVYPRSYDIRGVCTGRYSTSIAHGLPDVADNIDGVDKE